MNQARTLPALLMILLLPVTGSAANPLLVQQLQQGILAGDTAGTISALRQAISATEDAALREDLWRRLALLHRQSKALEDEAHAWTRAAEALAEQGSEMHPDIADYHQDASHAWQLAGEMHAALASAKASHRVDLANRSAHDQQRIRSRQRVHELALALGDQQTAMAHAPVRLRGGPARQPVPDPLTHIRGDYGKVNEDNFARVRVFFATDRKPTGDQRINRHFGNQRGELSFGSVEISVPANHKPGAIESPSLRSFEVRETPERHMVLLEIATHDGDEALRLMRETLVERDSDEAFVFVHGYNVSFAGAARRTAQLAYDMNFDGLPIFYAWPSRGSTLDYIADTAVVRHSGRHLFRFLEALVADSGAKRIHLVGHSMGNRALTDALELFSLRHADRQQPAFDQVIFTAPDVDSGLFQAMLPTLRPTARRMTLYASATDRALITSQRLHGAQPRAGQAGPNILIDPLIDTIDMTELGEDALGHSYFANHPDALTDLLALFWRNQAPEARCGLTAREQSPHLYWRFQQDQCDGRILLSAMALLRQYGDAAQDHAQQMLATAQTRQVPLAEAEWRAISQAIAVLAE